jgi:hypothetical protein
MLGKHWASGGLAEDAAAPWSAAQATRSLVAATESYGKHVVDSR